MNAKLADFSELSKFLSLKVQVGFDLFSFLLWEGAEAEPQHTEKKMEKKMEGGLRRRRWRRRRRRKGSPYEEEVGDVEKVTIYSYFFVFICEFQKECIILRMFLIFASLEL